MIRHFSVVLIVLFFLQSNFNTFVYIQFKMEQDYIASELCVQKDVRMNTCKGTCYLKAHLQKESEDSDLSVSYVKEKTELYFSESIFYQMFLVEYVKKIYSPITFSFPVQRCNDIFHPPAFV